MKKQTIGFLCSVLLLTYIFNPANAAPSDTELWNMWKGIYKEDPNRWSSPTGFDCMDRAWKSMIFAYGAVHAYEYSGDTHWLDVAAAGLDILKTTVRKNPRGEDAFITASDQFFNPGNGFQGVDVGGESFRMILGFAQFAGVVLNAPNASSALKAKANEYLAFVKDNLWVRWDRDWWYQSDSFALIHPNAGVYRYPTYPEFTPNPSKKCHTSQYNKQHEAGRVNLYLWKATKDSSYWHKARRQIVNYLSKCRLFDSGTRYEWDYGNPAGPYDGGCENKSWIEHRGGYMRLTTQYVVDCWLEGITVDMKENNRFVKAMLAKIWDGNITNPSFALNDGSSMGSGGPLTAFVGFDDKVAEICANSINNTYKADKLHGLMEGIPLYLRYKKLVKAGRPFPDAAVVDYTPPKVIRATSINKGKVEIEFDEEMDQTSVLKIENWILTRGIPTVGVKLLSGNKKVYLYTEEQTTGTSYRLTINATDKSGNIFFNHMFQRPEFTANDKALDHSDMTDIKSGKGVVGSVIRERLTIGQNPFVNSLVIMINDPGPGECVHIFDGKGELVTSLAPKTRLLWKGLDDKGSRVNDGVYFVRLGDEVEKVMLVR